MTSASKLIEQQIVEARDPRTGNAIVTPESRAAWKEAKDTLATAQKLMFKAAKQSEDDLTSVFYRDMIVKVQDLQVACLNFMNGKYR